MPFEDNMMQPDVWWLVPFFHINVSFDNYLMEFKYVYCNVYSIASFIYCFTKWHSLTNTKVCKPL